MNPHERPAVYFVAAALTLLLPVIAAAAPGDLDPTFGTGGFVTTPIVASAQDFAEAVLLQQDGKIVAAGYSDIAGDIDFALARYNSDGTLDTSFGSGGKLTTPIRASADDYALAAVRQTDGKFVVAGYSILSGSDFVIAMARYNSDGSFDSGFGTGGKVTTTLGGRCRAAALVQQPDGKIVVGGDSSDGTKNSFAILRYNTDGSLDTGFGTGGVTTLSDPTNMEANALVRQSDGKFVVAGHVGDGSNMDFALARFDSSGNLDTSFGAGGKMITSFGGTFDVANHLAVQSDGKLVAVGYCGEGIDDDIALVRYNTDGSLDSSFGTGGKVRTAVGTAQDEVSSVVIDSLGRLVVTGFSQSPAMDYDVALLRYLANGSLDPTFGAGGKVTTAVGTSNNEAFSVVLQPDGKIVAAGAALTSGTWNFLVLRYDGGVGSVCGNGIPEYAETCDDGNSVSGDCCSAGCQYESAGSACTSDDNSCTTDLCDAGGACLHAAGNTGAVCRGAAGVCDPAEHCDGVISFCPADARSTAPCRGSAGECDVAEFCDGASVGCPSDGFASGAVACSTDGNDCTDDHCSGGGSCTHTGNAAACDDGVFCNGFDTCSGSTCSQHAGSPCAMEGECGDSCDETADVCADPSGTPCSTDGNVCTDDTCDGSGNCGTNNSASCDDGLYCNGADICGGGSCNHGGNPCPGTECNNCQEGNDSCFDSGQTPCADEPDECTLDRCDGAGTCAHPPIPLAEVCYFAVVGGSDSVVAKVRTRLAVEVDGSICADRGDIGLSSIMHGGSSWVLMRDSGTAAKVRGFGTLEDGDAVTAGGCFKGSQGAEIYGTGLSSICCAESPADVPDAGVVEACGNSSMLSDCMAAKSQVASDVFTLDALSATQTLGALNCTADEPCSIHGNAPLNVVDLAKASIANDGVLTVDAQGNPDAVFVLRFAAGIRTKLRAAILLAGGAQARNLVLYAASGSCDFGIDNVGAGTLFCPAGRVRMKIGSSWEGAIAAGKSVDLGDNVILTHVPFLGLAF